MAASLSKETRGSSNYGLKMFNGLAHKTCNVKCIAVSVTNVIRVCSFDKKTTNYCHMNKPGTKWKLC